MQIACSITEPFGLYSSFLSFPIFAPSLSYSEMPGSPHLACLSFVFETGFTT